MGHARFHTRIRFASVNLWGDPDYREGMVRHHNLPLQTQSHRDLGPFLESLRDDGLHIDDFATNGVLLPMLTSVSQATNLPVHFGGHPNYNAQIIERLQVIRVFCESIRLDSRRRNMALAGVRGVQKRARAAIIGQRVGHIDHVRLVEPGTANLIAEIDQMLAARTILTD